MDDNRPVLQGQLRLVLGRLFPGHEINWEEIFAPAPVAAEVPTPLPPPVITGQLPLSAEEISQLRAWIRSSETGPLTGAEVDEIHGLLATKGKG